jgi:hypothetical protein
MTDLATMTQRALASVLSLMLSGCVATSGAEMRRCRPGPGASGTPNSIADVVTLINTLPRPVTVSCVVEALDHPLRISATSSIVSAQPAAGPHDPRIFIAMPGLLVSVVAAGDGQNLLEFGEFEMGTALTRKAEIIFPIEGRLAPSDPFAHLVSSTTPGSICGGCHASESLAASVDGAPIYRSIALRPLDETLVEVDALRAEWANCDASTDAERCAILDGIFAWGSPESFQFARSLPTL